MDYGGMVLQRNSTLCVDVNTLSTCNPEPFSVEWLKSAANNSLVNDKELFELPEYNDNIFLSRQFAFSEDTFTYQQWEDTECRYGTVDINCYNKSKLTIYYPKTFYSFDNKPIHYSHWRIVLEEQNSIKISKSSWVLLKSIPVLHDWQVPETWEELLEVCKPQSYDIKMILKESFKYLRDGIPYLFLLGFPIPKFWFQENEIIYWKAFLLPTLSYGRQIPKGFRNNQTGYWHRDITEVLKTNLRIDWQ